MSQQSNFPKYKILDTEVDRITIDEAVEFVVDYSKRDSAEPAYLVKLYVELLERAASDAAIHKLLHHSLLAVPEGVSAQWAASYLYNGRPGLLRAVRLAASIIFHPAVIKQPIPEKFGGTVFTLKLLQACQKEKVTVYLIGSPKESDISNTEKFLNRAFPKLKIVGTHPGSLGALSGAELAQVLDDEPIEKDLVNELNRLKPDIIFVAMGFPLQERIIAKILPQVKHGFFIGEGGTFDYDKFGGVNKKAPVWVQRIGLEWLWRLALEPTRIGRQMTIPAFMWRVYRSSLKQVRSR